MFNFLPFNGFDGKVKRNFNDVEPQEVFLDKLSRRKEEEMGVSERKMRVPLPGWILKIFAIFVFGALLILLGRSFHLQVIEAGEYQKKAFHNRTILEPTEILRGVMYDKDDDQLVYNSTVFDLAVDKSKFESKDKPIKKLADSLQIKEEKLKEKIKSIKDSGEIATNIPHEAAIMVEINKKDFPGITVERTIEREYEQGKEMAHVIGYTGEVTEQEIESNTDEYSLHDYIGKSGLEKYYEDELAKERGSYRIEMDPSGNVVEREEVNPVVPGNNLDLRIDLDLQNKIIEETNEVLKEVGSSKASVVAMNPKTGGVLSMVSIPSYDNNVFSRTGDKELLNKFLTDEDSVFLNRAVENTYPAGSVIKPLLASAALEEEIISPQKEIHSPGYFEIPNPWNPSEPTRMMDFEPHGWTDMREAIAVSSNVYFYTIGGGDKGQEGLGIRRMKKYLNLYGWGEETNIDLPNDKEGVIPDPEWKEEAIDSPWALGDTYNTAIGQGYLKVTPLQVANSYCAIANGGTLFEPKIVEAIYDSKGEKVRDVTPEVKREGFISNDNLKVAREGMKMTTTSEEGTASYLGTLPVTVGAKTGTAQISKEDHYHNWIALFAPYEDPEIVMVIMVEEVEEIQSTTSLIAHDVLDWYFGDKNKDEED